MIVDERLLTYLSSLESGNGAFLDALEAEALAQDVPIIRKDMQSLLKVLLALKNKADLAKTLVDDYRSGKNPFAA